MTVQGGGEATGALGPGPLSEDAALRAIVEGVEAETGDEFFRSLVRHLAAALAVNYAFVSELAADRQSFRTLAVWGRGDFLPNFEIPVAGTPCEAVLGGHMGHHAQHLQALFPEDKGLADWCAESYCGVPLLDSSGAVVGHLAIIDDKPMWDGPRGTSVMRIFAARARAEIDRKRAETALRESQERLARILDSAMDAIITFDATRRIELFNDAAEQVFACPAADAIGQPLDRFLTAAFGGAIARALDAFEHGGAAPYVWAPDGLTARGADGREFPIEATISRAEAGDRTLYTLILRDIDARRRAEEELSRLHRQNEYLQEEIRAVHNVDEIVGDSRSLHEVLEQVQLVAATDSSALILGETGTGKELIARAIHSRSLRKDRPLIKVNCAALPAGLIESELFGHEKGAFTGAHERRIGRFELANGGTIFLDEIGDLPPEVQVKLLRVLQEHEVERVGGSTTVRVDVRVIAATNRDLVRAVADGTFREDLYYRLSVFPVPLPPLRARTDDIPLLVHYFVGRFAAKIGRKITRVPKAAMERLITYPWPGNVRELENVIERAVILSAGPELEIADEPLSAPPSAPPVARPADRVRVRSRAAPGAVEEIDRERIVAALRQTQWRVDGPHGAARLLNVNASLLRSRIKKLGIRRSEL